VRWLEGNLGSTGHGVTLRKQTGSTAQAALAILKEQASILRLNNPVEELALMRSVRDELSYEHVRFQQIYKGIPVWGRDLYVHFNSQGTAYLINGTYEPTPAGVETTPRQRSTDALQVVVDDLKAHHRWQPLSKEAASFLGISEPTADLVLYPSGTGAVRLAYEVSIHPNLVEWYSYMIDAVDGRVLNKIARHCTLWPHDESKVPASTMEFELDGPTAPHTAAGSFAPATATDLNGVSQSLRVWNDGAGTYYMVWDLPNFDAGKSQLPDNPAGGGLTLSAKSKDLDQNVKLVHVVSPNNTWTDASAVSAHFNMKVAYDYYKNTHNRKAIDNQDQSIISIVHVTQGGKGLDNAYWNGRVMAYGDGDQEFKPLAGGKDVAGHEMTHGVIQHTADLIYQNQSGALNESFADVFGVMIDRANYLMGEDIMKAGTGKSALRDLSNPKNTQILSPQPSTMTEYQNLSADQDNGGVHINSGVPNKAAYLVINAITREKAERIYYRALSNYLTRNSQFGDCRKAVEQAANDLKGQSGITDADAAAIGQAFDAVGITATTGAGGGGNDVPPVSGGKSWIAFMLENGQIGLFDVASGTAATLNDANAVARASIQTGDRAQLSTGLDGQRIWFINQNGQLAFVDLTSGQVSVFSQLMIQQAGDLWNASISPDEQYVSISSAYANDPNLYIYDGQQLGRIELKPESTQEGIKVQTIQYPDVVSWSPNQQKPKIAFDAYNEVDVGTSGKVGYWSMYEIDFAVSKIYSLISSQPTNVSVGNVTYSNTNPDVIAFNYIDPTGKFDVYVGNFDTGQLRALNIPSFTFGGTSVVDGERPTFSPDDKFVCFTSALKKALFFYDSQSSQLTASTFTVALYNPRWFVQGGTVPTSAETEQVPIAFHLYDNYPNPFNPSTKIEYEVPTRAYVRILVYDILGQLVRTLVSSEQPSGRFTRRWDGTDESGNRLASGIYVYRMDAVNASGRSSVLSRKMLLLR
jgi:Zn-dependent metalloprotease